MIAPPPPLPLLPSNLPCNYLAQDRAELAESAAELPAKRNSCSQPALIELTPMFNLRD